MHDVRNIKTKLPLTFSQDSRNKVNKFPEIITKESFQTKIFIHFEEFVSECIKSYQ